MTYIPDTVVEVAFDSGYATPAVDRTWTDVSAYVNADDAITIGFGRSDERSNCDANTLTLTLDNSDGRFTAGLASGAYYPNVKIGRPIRVTTTPVGGTASIRFVGYVDEWPVAWDGTDEHATATITASSRMARLGIRAELRSIIDETVALSAPVAHWPFSEAEGAIEAADVAGNGAPPLEVKRTGTPVIFGDATGPGTDDATAVTFSGGKFLRTTQGPGIDLAQFTFEGYFLTRATAGYLLYLRSTGLEEIQITFPSAGELRALVTDSTGVMRTVASGVYGYNNGVTHHFALVIDTNADDASLYVDGVVVDSFAASSIILAAPLTRTIIEAGQGFTGALSHYAMYDYALSAAEVLEHAQAGLTGFAGESTEDRFLRYAGMAGIPTAEVSAPTTGSTTCAHTETTGASALDLLHQVEAAEGGVLYDDRDGTLVLAGRGGRYNPTSTLTLDMATQQVGADVQPKYDRSSLINDATVASHSGAVVAREVDATSVDEYGPAAVSQQTLSDSTVEPQAAASWLVAAYSEPQYRVPSLTVNLLDFDAAPSQNDVLAATIGTLLTVENQPSQAAVSDASYFVEGYTETITGTSYDLTFNVSPSLPWLDVMLLNTTGRNVLNTNILGY